MLLVVGFFRNIVTTRMLFRSKCIVYSVIQCVGVFGCFCFCYCFVFSSSLHFEGKNSSLIRLGGCELSMCMLMCVFMCCLNHIVYTPVKYDAVCIVFCIFTLLLLLSIPIRILYYTRRFNLIGDFEKLIEDRKMWKASNNMIETFITFALFCTRIFVSIQLTHIDTLDSNYNYNNIRI